MENTSNATVIIKKLQEENAIQKQQIAELNAKLEWFMEQFKLSQHQKFGRSSEKTVTEQLSFFNEAESEAKPESFEPTVEEITYKRSKKVGHREEMLKDLPVETIEYQLPEEELDCDCGSKLHAMSNEVRTELKIVPPKVNVVKHVQYVYACRNCEKTDIKTTIKTAPMPKPALPGSIASASAIAHVMSEKFVKGLPLYRQEQDWKRMGVNISRQTMANWIIKSSDRWLRPLYERMREHLVQKDILHADETVLQVLKEPGRPATSKSYMWLYRTGREGPSIVLYDYKTTRAGKHPKRFLSGYKGYLNTDGYSGYNDMSGIINVACWAHARRGFTDALKSMPQKKNDKPTLTEEGLAFCNRLFEIEKELHDVTVEERYEGRLIKSRPVLDKFKDWLKYYSSRVAPKTALGKAIKYCRNRWDKLEAFLLDGRLEIDNNRAERSIKPFVIGRKGWLFCASQKGASASATVYSLVETSKENGLNPFAYLTYLFEKLPNIDIKNNDLLDSVMPWSATIPEVCKVKK